MAKHTKVRNRYIIVGVIYLVTNTTRQKKKIRIWRIRAVLSHLNLTNVYRTQYTNAEYSFSSAYGIFPEIDVLRP